PLLRDDVMKNLVLVRIEGRNDRFCGAQRNFVFAAAASVNECHAKLHLTKEFLFPSRTLLIRRPGLQYGCFRRSQDSLPQSPSRASSRRRKRFPSRDAPRDTSD